MYTILLRIILSFKISSKALIISYSSKKVTLHLTKIIFTSIFQTLPVVSWKLELQFFDLFFILLLKTTKMPFMKEMNFSMAIHSREDKWVKCFIFHCLLTEHFRSGVYFNFFVIFTCRMCPGIFVKIHETPYPTHIVFSLEQLFLRKILPFENGNFVISIVTIISSWQEIISISHFFKLV